MDEKKIGDIIESKVREVFSSLVGKPAGEAPPSATPDRPAGEAGPHQTPADGSLAAMINNAVATALKERDRDDQQYVLQEEINKLKEKVERSPKRTWADFLVGPLFR